MLSLLGGDVAEGLRDLGYDRDTLRLAGWGRTSEQAVGTGQKDQQSRLHQLGNLCGKAVVVAEAKLLDGHRVVLVDDRDHPGRGE